MRLIHTQILEKCAISIDFALEKCKKLHKITLEKCNYMPICAFIQLKNCTFANATNRFHNYD